MKKKLASSGEMSRYESAAYPFLWESTSKERKKPKSPINNRGQQIEEKVFLSFDVNLLIIVNLYVDPAYSNSHSLGCLWGQPLSSCLESCSIQNI